MSHLSEVQAAINGARSACDLPVAVTMSFDTHGHTMMGTSGYEMAERLRPLELVAVGANCGGQIQDTVNAALELRAEMPNTPLIIKPNAGVPQLNGAKVTYSGTPAAMARAAKLLTEIPGLIFGGCCGSTLQHVAAVAGLAGTCRDDSLSVAAPSSMWPRWRERWPDGQMSVQPEVAR